MTACHTLPGGARLQLLAHKAAFDPALGLLLVADAHLGKAVSFRRLGVPVPAGTTLAALGRLDAMLAATGAREIVFLGDLLHSVRALAPGTLAEVQRWRDRHPALVLTLVRGNHDAHAGDPPPGLGVQCHDGPLHRGPWALVHEPQAVDGAYALAGHVHPGVVLAGRARQSLRLPCFHFGRQCAVLPAFGEFTGLHVLPRGPGDAVYAVAEDRVMALATLPA
ncbi:ligase-associated DNA damage response endonuclease PdeM [Aquabacterium sp. OR-4]|uniref:ligase-associated DNA damage response endonuclease PdeM n=1 Tax=Aquabacterium sp. OR-4 TaxID=2978127 RepID=UPI0021B1AF2C|nr:ligase-associated DNA damage response endonuclease PdeM [Aquabacterium sp. OR-4]MDT7834565.1 ligase-associated DNA damage response endonuclease PdeM [Aquabacterium sp. OR-4]